MIDKYRVTDDQFPKNVKEICYMKTIIKSCLMVLLCFSVNMIEAEYDKQEEGFKFSMLPDFGNFFNHFNRMGSDEFQEALAEETYFAGRESYKATFGLGVLAVKSFLSIKTREFEEISKNIELLRQYARYSGIREGILLNTYEMVRLAGQDRWIEAEIMLQELIDSIQTEMLNDGNSLQLTLLQTGSWIEMVNRFSYMLVNSGSDRFPNVFPHRNYIDNIHRNLQALYRKEPEVFSDLSHGDNHFNQTDTEEKPYLEIQDNLSNIREIIEKGNRGSLNTEAARSLYYYTGKIKNIFR